MSELKAFNEKFKVDELLVFETQFWKVSVRPQQLTLGSLVLSLKNYKTSLAQLTADEGADLARCINELERRVNEHFEVSVFNYLALMLVDANVHFHVFPRYEEAPHLNGQAYLDEVYPKPLDILACKALELEPAVIATKLRK